MLKISDSDTVIVLQLKLSTFAGPPSIVIVLPDNDQVLISSPGGLHFTPASVNVAERLH